MSILIKGMEMPKDCLACRFRDGAWCIALGTDNWRSAYNTAPKGERLPDCPLVKVPEHGRLIDADALEAYWKPDHNRYFDADYFIHTIESAPTIIPAEED